MPKLYCPSSTGADTPPTPSDGTMAWLGRLKLRATAPNAKCVLGRYDRPPVMALSESRYASLEYEWSNEKAMAAWSPSRHASPQLSQAYW